MNVSLNSEMWVDPPKKLMTAPRDDSEGKDLGKERYFSPYRHYYSSYLFKHEP